MIKSIINDYELYLFNISDRLALRSEQMKPFRNKNQVS